MIRRVLTSLRVRLAILTLFTIAPMLGLTLVTYGQQRAHEAAQVQQEALRLARLAALDQERVIDATEQLLVTLARLPALRAGDLRECAALLADLLQQNPLYANLGAITPDGYIWCSALALSEPVYVGDRSYFTQAVHTRAFAIGDYQIGRVTGRPSINFGYPVVDSSGRLLMVLFAALDLAWLNDLPLKVRLPAEATLTVVDRQGKVLARYPERDWVGRDVSDAPIVQAILSGQAEGTAETVGLSGDRRLLSWAPLGGQPQPSAYVSIGVPTAVAYAELDRTLMRSLATLGLSGVLVLAGAWVGSDLLLLRPVRALVRATAELRSGNFGVRTGVPHGPGEINQLARAFDEMAEGLERAQEQQRREEELRRLNYRLEQQNLSFQEADRLKTEFVSMVSHELRAPLTSISGYVALLLEGAGGDLNDEQREFLTIVMKNADRLLALINDLLDISRVEAGRIDLHRQVLDLSDAIAGAVALMQPQFEAKQQRVVLELPEELPPVFADADRVAQILTNLLSNASKYTPAGGNIIVRAAPADGSVRVAIQDNGIGLSPAEQAQVFTKFFRARNRLTEQTGGTGLGLAITRSLVELHGGAITVASAPGEGSTFSFTLPTVAITPDLEQ